ncbi:UDP-N-acetylglucosamine 1-carboxyvinyltransferase [Patescibacteria group bacterium]|nr:UDP-N-acetylglucosamine 1-carboxyvinyltransferase [Patescibacteria group bacterium]
MRDIEKFIVKGRKKLIGKIRVSGSKNVALKVLVAACLTDEEVVVENVPLITDFLIMTEIIEQLGGVVKRKDHSYSIKLKEFSGNKIFLDKAAEIRTSFMFLAPLLARERSALIPNPGGCRIGARPIGRIVNGLQKMGVKIDYEREDGYFHARTGKDGLTGTEYAFSKNSHTGTETMLLAAVLAKGKTVLKNAAEEPEVDELIDLLNKMGAKIKRTKPRVIEIQGVKKLHGVKFKIGPDRNEVVTFAVAAIMTRGDILVEDIKKESIKEFLEKLDEIGAGYKIEKNGIRFFGNGKLKSTDIITNFYPGFMTDWQGPWTILMTQAFGVSKVHETVYENRFTYVDELNKMGSDIRLFNPVLKNPAKVYNFNITDDNNYYHAVEITGPVVLHNAAVNIADLRAGATLVIAALAARGESVIFGIEHLDRGYENFEKRLLSLGANIKRVTHE